NSARTSRNFPHTGSAGGGASAYMIHWLPCGTFGVSKRSVNAIHVATRASTKSSATTTLRLVGCGQSRTRELAMPSGRDAGLGQHVAHQLEPHQRVVQLHQ